VPYFQGQVALAACRLLAVLLIPAVPRGSAGSPQRAGEYNRVSQIARARAAPRVSLSVLAGLSPVLPVLLPVLLFDSVVIGRISAQPSSLIVATLTRLHRRGATAHAPVTAVTGGTEALVPMDADRHAAATCVDGRTLAWSRVGKLSTMETMRAMQANASTSSVAHVVYNHHEIAHESTQSLEKKLAFCSALVCCTDVRARCGSLAWSFRRIVDLLVSCSDTTAPARV